MKKHVLEELNRMRDKQYCAQVKEFIYMLYDAQTLFGNHRFKNWERHALGWLITLIEKEEERLG